MEARSRQISDESVARLSVDLDDLNHPHTMAILSVRPGSRVLDIGCGTGAVAEALSSAGCRVWGLEIDGAAARAAEPHCREVRVADVEGLDLAESFAETKFDFVLLLDVLEHLRDPGAALRQCRKVLDPGGRVIASIPNVTHGAVRLHILRGQFRYSPSGLLDRSHLRFFDREGVGRLFDESDFEIHECLRVVRDLHETELELDLEGLPDGLVEMIRSDPDATTYQYVVTAGARRANGISHPKERKATLRERLQAEVEELTRLVGEGETYARHLEREISQVAPLRERIEELTRLVREGETRARELERETLQMGPLRERVAKVETAEAVRERELAALREERVFLERALSANEGGTVGVA